MTSTKSAEFLTQKNGDLKKTFGIDLSVYYEMLESQNGVCAICQGEQGGDRYEFLAVDHCHDTGRIRGLLCTNCNHALGWFKDDIARLQRATEYLKEHRGEDPDARYVPKKGPFPCTCEICGTQFESRRRESWYCSTACRARGLRNIDAGREVAAKRPTGRQGHTLDCMECGKQFWTLNKNQECCSKPCARTHYWRHTTHAQKSRKGASRSLDCLHCETSFETTDSRKKYCSEACKIAYNNARRGSDGVRRTLEGMPSLQG